MSFAEIKLKYLLILALLLTGLTSKSQRLRFFIPGTIDAGLHFARIEKDSTSTWAQKPGSTIHLKTGAGLLLNQRVGLWAEGGLLLNNYKYVYPAGEYSITNQSWSLLLTPFVLLPLREDLGTHLHFGAGLGWTYHLSDRQEHQETDFSVMSEAFSPRSFTICPEVGITNIKGRTSVEVLLSYHYQDISGHTVTTEINDANGIFRADGKGDYLALRIRLGFELGGRRDPSRIFVSPPAEAREFAGREESVIQNFSTRRKAVKLFIGDSGEIDSDSISVTVNGNYILTHYSLKRKPKKIRI
ncbi:MAG: hypothetical protein RL220_43, partial [Bacteroidota bacterium]